MKKDVNYYISKGLDKKTAEYYISGRKKIISVIPTKDFSLIITFDNQEKRLLDCKPFILDGTVFAFLKSFDNFKRVYVDDTHCIAWDKDPNIDSEKVWHNKVDISSDSCYLDSIALKNDHCAS